MALKDFIQKIKDKIRKQKEEDKRDIESTVKLMESTGLEVLVRPVVEKAIKRGMQVLVSVILANKTVGVVTAALAATGVGVTPEIIALVVLAGVSAGVEAVRNVVKRKVQVLAPLL